MKQGDFTEVAKYYYNRPAYSTILIEKLIKCVNDLNKTNQKINVVEVGAGTGKLTKILANFGLNITAVEPNDAMRNEGIIYTKNTSVKWINGSGEKTNIDSDTADWVIMASSFHWTNPQKSLPEFSRILNKNGYFTAIWNPRNITKNSIFEKIEQEIKNIVPELNRVSSGTQNTRKWEEILISTGHFKDCILMECDYIEMMDKERYIGAWHSVNDIQAQAGEKRWQEILAMIEDKIKNIRIVEIPYKIRAWTVKKS